MGHSGSDSIEANASVSWTGWGGKVTGGSGALSAATATQVELGGPGGGTNPEELLAAALANCYTSTLTSLARAKHIELVGIVTSVRTRLAWDENTPHHIAQGDLTVRITADAPEDRVVRLANEARDHCPVCNVLKQTAEVTLAVSVVKNSSV
jgi:organic hydroperoxide reductase OsmC/OhrA